MNKREDKGVYNFLYIIKIFDQGRFFLYLNPYEIIHKVSRVSRDSTELCREVTK